jgi:hypothetical protein
MGFGRNILTKTAKEKKLGRTEGAQERRVSAFFLNDIRFYPPLIFYGIIERLDILLDRPALYPAQEGNHEGPGQGLQG